MPEIYLAQQMDFASCALRQRVCHAGHAYGKLPLQVRCQVHLYKFYFTVKGVMHSSC